MAASILSDDRFRGYSVSDDRPVAILDASYDSPTGVYGAISGVVVASPDDGIQPLGLQIGAGYAKRLRGGLSLDLGVTHSSYSRYASRGSGKSYSEAYAGLGGKNLSARFSISPDYLQSHHWSAYGEVNGSLGIAPGLRLNGHIGMLVPLTAHGYDQTYHREVDWRIGAAMDVGRVTFSAAWTGVARGSDLSPRPVGRHRALVAGLAYAL